MNRRADAEELVARIAEMVANHRHDPVPRRDLAERWGVTPRSVSNLIVRAEGLLGVKIRHREGGYVVTDCGLLNPKACARLLCAI